MPGSFFGRGEQSAAAPGLAQGGEQLVIRNAKITGPGTLIQQSDFLLADTCKNSGAAENHVVCGIFPFQTQGGASGASEAIWISLDATNDKLRLHQVGEDHKILRSYDIPGNYTPTVPPQITGVEMFGKFYFVEYGAPLAVNRLGMCVFDPAGAGAVTRPTYELVAGGTAAAALRFRGITSHRGASLVGWGYDEEGSPEGASILRTAKWGAPDTWVPDTSEISAFRVPVGTVGVPIVGLASSDLFTVIGKETEIFALDGDYSSQFYPRDIGKAFGPISTVGICSYGRGACWWSAQGPAKSEGGQQVELMGQDQIVRRLLNYMDPAKVCAAHDVDNHRVAFSVRRRFDDDGVPINEDWATELMYWDYVRDQFYVGDVPTKIFSIGSSKGPGVNLPGPTGVVSAIVADALTQCSARISWTPGDTAPDVQFEVQYKVNGTTTWLAGGTTGTQVTTLILQNLTPGIHYDVQVRQVRNSQFSAYTTSLDLFTTIAVASIPTPTSVDSSESDFVPPTTAHAQVTFGAYQGCGLYAAEIIVGKASEGVTGATDPNADQASRNMFTFVGDVGSSAGYFLDPTDYFINGLTGVGPTLFYWLRFRLVGSDSASAWVAATPVGGLQILGDS